MDEDTFLAEVGRRLDLSRERAEQVTTAVLQRLRERIGGEAAHMDAQLPAGLKLFWHEPALKEEVIRLHKDEFFGRVAMAADLTEADVPRAVKVVFKVLQKALKSPTGEEGEAWDVFSRLPKDLKKVWTAAAHLSDTAPKPKEAKTPAKP
jgi:uncharacterized protein (DUF2267 family)